MERKLLGETTFQYLLHLFDETATQEIHEFILHSKIYPSRDPKAGYSDAYLFEIVVHPEIFKKFQHRLGDFGNAISAKFYHITKIYLTRVEIYPDLNKFQILENRLVPIETPWEEINQSQAHLLQLLRTGNEIVDFQNIGNASRTLLQKLAGKVFNPQHHISDKPDTDLREGKFKNRLHAYVKCEMDKNEDKELKDYAVSVITTAEKAIDLANKLTHDLKANSLMAEFCVISTITVVSIVRLINK